MGSQAASTTNNNINFNLPENADAKSFLDSKGQIEARLFESLSRSDARDN